MRLWTFRILSLVSLFVLIFTQQVMAFTQNDINCTLNTTCFYDPSQTCASGNTSSATDDTSSSSNNDSGIAINSQAALQAAQQASTGSTKVGYALYDSTGNLLASYNDTFENYGASITKAMILVAYLNQVGSGTLTSSETTNVTGMIEDSNDTDANNVYGYLDNPASQIQAVAQQAGMSGFKYNDQADSTYFLGQSQITANDFAKFFSKIDTMFPATQKSFALNLLSNITQQVGLLQAGLPGTVYSKEGWKPEPGGPATNDLARSGNPNPFGNEGAPWIVNQAAQFSSGSTTYGVAVTVGGAPDQTTGETIVKNVVSALISQTSLPSSETNSSCCPPSGSGSSLTSLTGNDNESKAFNFFVQEGLSQAQAAGVVANLLNESGFITTVGGSDPTTSPVFGIAQWTPGSMFAADKQLNNIQGSDTDLLTQLEVIWAEMNGNSSQGFTNILPGLKAINDPSAAAVYFRDNFEKCNMSYTSCSDRGSVGLQVYQQYGNGGSGGVTSSTSCINPASSQDCTTVTGDAKILCEAEPFKGVYYEWSGGHESLSQFQAQCPDPSNPPDNQPSGGPVNGDPAGESGNPSPCAVDCSGLVDIATDEAFNVDMGGANVAGIESSPYWQKLTDMASVQPGDIVTVDPNVHVEIVDHYDSSSGILYTFGAHLTGEQDGEVTSTLSSWSAAYRYVGPGSSQ